MNANLYAPALTEQDQLRADIYSLLAALLRAVPSSALLDWLKHLDTDSQDGSEMGTAWLTLQLAAQRCQPEQLNEEYQDLFIGLGRGELVPFGSWYLTGSLMETPLAILRQDLKLLGYVRAENIYEPEDHAAALFEVMASLIENGRPLTTQQRFYQRHLGEWIGRFFRDLQRANAAVFYSSVGSLGRAFTDFETDAFAAVDAQCLTVSADEE